MSSSFRVFVSFSKTKVNNVYYMLIFTRTNKIVIRFYISVQESVLMHKFNSLQLMKYYN